MRNTQLPLPILCFAWLGLSSSIHIEADETVRFSQDIQPLIAEKCLNCHGPDKAEGGLRLDQEQSSRKELESGDFAVVPGKPDEGTLLQRIQSKDKSEQMPPEGKRLRPDDIEKIRKWIQEGARYDRHWSFKSIKIPSVPNPLDKGWVRNDIDRFVLSVLNERGIQPSKEADRTTLIKRLYYDLVGLPPTPEEVDRFVSDRSPRAYENLVDKLLASRHFGERWGRHWLDKARYADSDGYEKDRPRPNAWRYRDWVIEAINRDMPFDQFTIQQIAGDLLPNPTEEQRLATAFHRQTLTNTEGGTDQEEFRVAATFDRTETTGAIWMGLTLSCARCHSHKYDPISQKEYYQLFAFFNDANEGNASVQSSVSAAEKYEIAKRDFDARIGKLQGDLKLARRSAKPEFDRWLTGMIRQLKTSPALTVHAAKLLEAKSQTGAKLEEQKDGAVLVTGATPDKDKYTVVLQPDLSLPFSGIRLEVLTDDRLPSRGPGRTAHGNFVLSQIRLYRGKSNDFKQAVPIKLASAEADFAQNKFSPEGALSTAVKSGWAISPQMGKKHTATFYTSKPVTLKEGERLQVVLDQQYGGQHVIGKFRLTTLSGFDPLRALPAKVAAAIRKSPTPDKVSQQILWDYFSGIHPSTNALSKEIQTLRKQAPQPPTMSVRVLVPAKRTTRILHRGDFLQPAEQVNKGGLKAIDDAISLEPVENRPKTAQSPEGLSRLDLAKWLVDQQHPLTSRVTVNHIWAKLFGRGIVDTVNDFGVRGAYPSHPQLLDWLAWNFARDFKWSRKQLIRTIALSSTYRQSSRFRADLEQLDPLNRWLGRQNRFRVSAEIVRDLHLSAAGLLSSKIGGPSVFPPLPAGVANLSYANNFKWKTSTGEDRYRRGMYTFFKRTSPHPNLVSFDCPDSNTANLQRDRSNTPLQALITLNNEVFVEASQGMSKRVLLRKPKSDREGIEYAIRICLSRRPASAEVNEFLKLLNVSRDYYREHPEDAKKITSRHAVESLPPIENAAWVATIRMIANLDEFIVRE